ncbi:hypothetical protein [Pseudomonas sp. PDM13]|uniref:hypothetical protein n=1 Tax=Pseudomonas sp. PDM13 TaxID=2769255 RepID=UPI00295AB2E1|nr:hypothetical protein [Pseudomonas sp. PDM13]
MESRTRDWRKALVLSLLTATFLAAWLSTGFYKTRFAEDNRLVFFIKKQPSFQVRFINPFATDADSKKLSQLSEEERQEVIDYCRYRLGIETELKTQEELDSCEQR